MNGWPLPSFSSSSSPRRSPSRHNWRRMLTRSAFLGLREAATTARQDDSMDPRLPSLAWLALLPVCLMIGFYLLGIGTTLALLAATYIAAVVAERSLDRS